MWQSNRASRQSIRHNHRHDRGETHKHTNHELKYSAKRNRRTPKRFAHIQIHSDTLRYTQIHSDTLKYTQIHSNTLTNTLKYTQIHSRIHSNTLRYTQIHSPVLHQRIQGITAPFPCPSCNNLQEIQHFTTLATCCHTCNTLPQIQNFSSLLHIHISHSALHATLCSRFNTLLHLQHVAEVPKLIIADVPKLRDSERSEICYRSV